MRACIICGCTEDAACVFEETGIACSWSEVDPRLCDFCQGAQAMQLHAQLGIALSLLPGILARKEVTPCSPY